MNPKSPTQFQNGLIDVFKTNKVFELNIVDCVKKGDVVVEMVHHTFNYYLGQRNFQKSHQN